MVPELLISLKLSSSHFLAINVQFAHLLSEYRPQLEVSRL
jgi:hypothetical protein